MGLVEHNEPASHFDVKPMTGRPKFIVRHSTFPVSSNKLTTLLTLHFVKPTFG
jgi:hypothetical protein